MRRYGVVFVLVLLSVAVWVSAASAIKGPQTFSLLEQGTPNSDQPLGDFTFDRAPVGGHWIAFTNALYRWKGTKRGARVGRDQVMITFITGFGADFSRKATALFSAEVFLPGGTIFAEGYGQVNPNGPSKYTFPILGGTGTYANVRGYVNVRDLHNDRTNIQFHLLPVAPSPAEGLRQAGPPVSHVPAKAARGGLTHGSPLPERVATTHPLRKCWDGRGPVTGGVAWSPLRLRYGDAVSSTSSCRCMAAQSRYVSFRAIRPSNTAITSTPSHVKGLPSAVPLI